MPGFVRSWACQLRMDPRQTRIKEIFSEAHELHEPQRTEFVVRACGRTWNCGRRFEKLLSSFAEPGELLESSLGAFLFKNAEGKSIEGPSTLREGDLIGSYRIIQAHWLRRHGGSVRGRGFPKRAAGRDQDAAASVYPLARDSCPLSA